jgi:hypothetical protein
MNDTRPTCSKLQRWLLIRKSYPRCVDQTFALSTYSRICKTSVLKNTT